MIIPKISYTWSVKRASFLLTIKTYEVILTTVLEERTRKASLLYWFLWQQDSLSCYSFYTWTLFNTNITFKRIEFTKLYRNHCLKRKRIACLFYLISMATGLSFMLLFIYSLQHLCIHNLLELNQATPQLLRIRPCSNELTWHHS